MRKVLDLGVAAILLAAAVVPFWLGRFFPFLDMPQHLALAAVVSHLGDSATGFSRFYQIDPHITPYWGYYAAMWLFGHFAPLELANRLILTGYALGVPIAVGYALVSFGRDWRWAVFSVPLVFNTNLFLGFAPFLVSIPLFLWALGLSERHLSEPALRLRCAVSLAVASMAVFLCHVETYLLLGMCVLILLAVHGQGLRWLAWRGAFYVPSLALFVTWAWRSFVNQDPASKQLHTVHHETFGTLRDLGAVYEPWRIVWSEMPRRLMGAFTDASDQRIFLAWFLVAWIALFACYGSCDGRLAAREDTARALSVRGDERTSLRARLRALRCDLLVMSLVATYLFLPMQVSVQWYVNARYLVFSALALPLLFARRPTGRMTFLLGASAAIAVVACANAGLKMRAFQRQAGDFGAIAAELPRGGRVLGLPFDKGVGGPVRLWPFLHWACYCQVAAGGDVGFSFAGLPSIPVRYRPGMQAPHPYEWRPDQFDWASMGSHYDAFLASGRPQGRGGFELIRHAVVVAQSGPFTLWKPRR
ncbi:MAG TPA: hypothetical protein VMK12_10680 [Anaeromyxobacteraceae bacterium]|nr:hypothetical protein [Anaeromyxobacteraceae bacterium]